MAARGPKGPPGGEVLRAVLARLKRGWPPGLTVLTGDDLFHLDAAQQAILERLLPPGECDALSLSVFGDRKVHVADVVSAASSAGMFASRRVVLLRDVEALEGERGTLSEYAADPPADSFLLVRAPRLDGRRALQKELAACPHVLAFRKAGPQETGALLREVESLAGERGLSLDRDAAGLLLAVCAGDLHRVCSELDKIAAWRGKEAPGRVGLPEIRDLVAGEGTLTGWEVADAVVARDFPRALAASRRLVSAGEEVRRTIGGLAWRARSMLQVRARIDAGEAPERAARSVWTGVDPRHLVAGLERYETGDLLRFPGKMLRASRTLNSRSIDAGAVLEELVEDLVGERR